MRYLNSHVMSVVYIQTKNAISQNMIFLNLGFTRWKCWSRIKAGFLNFSSNFSTYQCKILDQSNIVCEYEVNLSTNEKVITEKQNF